MTAQPYQSLRRAVLAAGMAATLSLSAGGAGLAQTAPEATRPVVLELYTSQGCVSCPPADEVFARLADEPGIIALALHVDYWDYLGWSDHFADPAFTARQKRYARAAGAKMIYTPQMILGGVSRIQGTREAEIRAEIARLAAQPAPVALRVARAGAGLQIHASAEPPLSHPAILSLVRYAPAQEVAIERGENAGQTISYRNVVTSWTVVAEWGGQADLALEVPLEGDAPVVVLVQEQGPGPVLAAHRLD